MYEDMYYRGCVTCASYRGGGRRDPLRWESLCDSLRVFDQVGKKAFALSDQTSV